VQLGVISGVSGLAVGDVPEADAGDIGDRAERLPVRDRESTATDKPRTGRISTFRCPS
jgi:hypothetical protein